ncbi:MAG: SDR family oxidoreductase [Gemmatimonadota bacterium]
MNRVLIVGATSAIAEATARRFARGGARLLLAGRSATRLRAVADDLRVRGAARVFTFELDVRDLARHEALFAEAEERLGGLDGVLVAHGVLPDQAECERSASSAAESLLVNGVSTVSLLTIAATRLERSGRGCIAVLGSVAGDRGRRSNYVYGAAKGMLDVFLQGLRHRLTGSGVRVVTIKPGPVDTPMTAQLPKSFLFADPADVGARVHRAMIHADGVVYVPWYWRWIMLGIRALPERVFRRTPL